MTKYTRFSARAGLAALGVWFRQKGIWTVVEEMVEIDQKVIKDTPVEKLLDAFINMLAGGRGNVEVNTRVRPDEGLQRAFGRERCAEQSVISETLNGCEEETIEQMRQAMQSIFQQHGRAFRHDYRAQCLVLIVLPTGAGLANLIKDQFFPDNDDLSMDLATMCEYVELRFSRPDLNKFIYEILNDFKPSKEVLGKIPQFLSLAKMHRSSSQVQRLIFRSI
jgi:hypothetical protein